MRIGDTPPVPPTSPGSGDDVMDQLKKTLDEYGDLIDQLNEDAKITDTDKRNAALQQDEAKFKDLMKQYRWLFDTATVEGLITPSPELMTDYDNSLGDFTDALNAARKSPPDLDTVSSSCQKAGDNLAAVMNLIWPW